MNWGKRAIDHLLFFDLIWRLDHGRFAGIMLVLLPLLLGGCSASDELSVDCHVFEDELNQKAEIMVAEGQEFTVTLCTLSNYGYHWSDAKIENPDVLLELSHDFEPGRSPMGGIPGKDIWIFRALTPGDAVINLEQTQPSGRNSRGIWTYRLVVNVESAQ